MAKRDLTLISLSMLDHLRSHPHGVDLREFAALYELEPDEALELIYALWTIGETDEFGEATATHMFDFDAAGLEEEEPWVRLRYDPVGTKPRRFTAEELASLQIGLEILRAGATSADRQRIDALLARFRRSDVALDAQQTPIVEVLREAIEAGQRLRIEYRAESDAEASTREIDPISLERHGGETYLSAWACQRNAHRWYRTDRILRVELTGEPSEPHSGPQPPMFSPSRRDVQVTLAVQPSAFEAVRPFLVYGGSIRAQSDGSGIAHIRFRNPRAVTRLVLEHVGAIRVVSPLVIREDVVDAANLGLTTLMACDSAENDLT